MTYSIHPMPSKERCMEILKEIKNGADPRKFGMTTDDGWIE